MVKLTVGLLYATLFVVVSTHVIDHHGLIKFKEEKIGGVVHSIKEKKAKKWDWRWWKKAEEEHSEDLQTHATPIWKIHKYKGVEVKPIYTIYKHPVKGHTYPPSNVHIHALPVPYEKPVPIHHASYQSPSPVYTPDTHITWQEDNAWKWPSTNTWSEPIEQEHYTIHKEETSIPQLHNFKSGWKSKLSFKLPTIEKVPDKETVIAYGELPDVPALPVPSNIEEISLPEISHIPLAIPIHQKTTTVIEHEVPQKVIKPAYEEHTEEYTPYDDSAKETQQLYNSYGEALPADAYSAAGSQNIEIIAPPPGIRIQGNVHEELPQNQKEIDEIEYPQHNYEIPALNEQLSNNTTTKALEAPSKLEEADVRNTTTEYQ